MLTFGCLETRLDWVGNLTGFGTESTYPNGTSCGYWLNSTSEFPVLMSGYLVESVNTSLGGAHEGETLLMRTLPLMSPRLGSFYGSSIHFHHIRNRIADVIISGLPNTDAVFRNDTPFIQECVLSWCIKTVKSSYYWANYEEEVLDTFMNTTGGPYVYGTSPGPLPTDPVFEYVENVTVRSPSAANDSLAYGLSNDTALAVSLVFENIFPSFTTLEQNSEQQPTLRLPLLGEHVLRFPDLNPWLPPNNVTLHMERLATAWTNAIRSSSSKNMTPGMAFTRETYVSVRWFWLTLPLSLLLFSLVFLAATIIKASRESERVGIWKTSAIATLLYGLPDYMQKKITLSAATGTPRAKAKDLRVKMLSKGWRISGSLFSPTTPKLRKNNPPPGWI